MTDAGGAASDTAAKRLDNWLAIQGINVTRHARSLRPFDKAEFGTGPAAPSEAHIEAANRFIDGLRERVVERTRWVDAAVSLARREPSQANLETVLDRKEKTSHRVLYVEGIWDFYFDLFSQRLSSMAERVRAVDRIGANCYEDTYLGLRNGKPTPRLLPFSYANSGFSPSTYRRGVPLTRLRFHRNLFPLVILPQHRLDNVWALSSVLHEISHNLQADLGLWDVVPKRVFERLTGEGRLPEDVARTYSKWHKEAMADLFALALGGPAAIESLMDVVGRSRQQTVSFSPGGVHPTPFLRVLMSLVMLRRLGLATEAAALKAAWLRLYPAVDERTIPKSMVSSFNTASELVVDTMAFTPYAELGAKSVVEVIEFGPAQMAAIVEAGQRLAKGEDPGTVPARFMIGAARWAVDRRLASPQAITDNFYKALGRR